MSSAEAITGITFRPATRWISSMTCRSGGTSQATTSASFFSYSGTMRWLFAVTPGMRRSVAAAISTLSSFTGGMPS